jgi:8-oxo-dGTP pyrophosphatase MutT (NUDIX family)
MTDISVPEIRRLLDRAFERQDLYSGDRDLNPGLSALFSQDHRPAAVLILLVERPEGLTVLLTKRPETLRVHAGQISFPGGGVEPGDNGPAGTALRETNEEIGLDPALVDILGYLPEYQTRTGFTVAPVVGAVKPPFTLNPNPAEVERVLEVPLSHFLNPENCRVGEKDYNGYKARFYSFQYGDDTIWGATAGMLRGLREALSGTQPMPLPAQGFQP